MRKYLAATFVLLGCGTYAAVTPSRLDPSPLMECTVDTPADLMGRFEDYRIHPVPDGQPTTSSTRAVQIASHDFQTDSADGSTHWRTSASLYLYGSTEASQDAFRRHCEMHASGFSEGDMKLSGYGDQRSCVTPVGQLRNDPEGGLFPRNSYFSAIVVERGPILLDLFETRTGPPGGTEPSNEIVSDIAQRLCRPH